LPGEVGFQTFVYLPLLKLYIVCMQGGFAVLYDDPIVFALFYGLDEIKVSLQLFHTVT